MSDKEYLNPEKKTVSTLIDELTVIKNEHGDVEVNLFVDGGEGETGTPYLCLLEEEDGKVVACTFGDRSYAEAFME